jgi:hypothetical protein
VAPGTNGNILTSNGTTWTSAAPASSGVTSLTAGNGITVSASTGAVTVSQDIYTGTTSGNTSYPIGTCLFVSFGTSYALTTARTLYFATNDAYAQDVAGGGRSALTGTWRTRGILNYSYSCSGFIFGLIQRTA